ncbi:hypothetical protein [Azospirillum cavernae]|uniref:hypothetical protein n=1 Tax=Azospirillum cavernae TaxID=2320860 RepID=UPI0018F68350|nr:hypothetical protein [Azospirillum cavernae]
MAKATSRRSSIIALPLYAELSLKRGAASDPKSQAAPNRAKLKRDQQGGGQQHHRA